MNDAVIVSVRTMSAQAFASSELRRHAALHVIHYPARTSSAYRRKPVLRPWEMLWKFISRYICYRISYRMYIQRLQHRPQPKAHGHWAWREIISTLFVIVYQTEMADSCLLIYTL